MYLKSDKIRKECAVCRPKAFIRFYSIVVITPDCHFGDRSSILRRTAKYGDIAQRPRTLGFHPSNRSSNLRIVTKYADVAQRQSKCLVSTGLQVRLLSSAPVSKCEKVLQHRWTINRQIINVINNNGRKVFSIKRYRRLILNIKGL